MASESTYILTQENILLGLADLRDQKLLCDVHLVAEDETFPVHRVVLAAASPYFQAMFTGGFKETGLNTITLKEISAEGLKRILDAVYTSKLVITDENVGGILSAGTLLQMNNAITKCEEYLCTKISCDNVLAFLDLSEKYELQAAVDNCNKFIPPNFEEVAKTEHFKLLSKERLCEYISDDGLRVPNGEMEVFRAVVDWLEKNGHTAESKDSVQKQQVSEVMQFVRLPFISADNLLDEIQQHPLIEASPPCKSMVKEALRFHTHLFEQPLHKGDQFKPRGEQKLVVMTFGKRGKGYLVEDDVTRLHVLDCNPNDPFSTEDFVEDIPLSFAYRSVSMVRKSNHLFVFGTLNKSFYPVALRFDVSTMKWIDLKPPPLTTVGSVALELNDEIYVIGGMHVTRSSESFNSDDCVPDTWRYSIGTNTWSKEADLPKSTAYHAATPQGNTLYVAGGLSDSEADGKSVHAFDTTGRLWLTKNEMIERRSSFNLETVGNSIYACGGTSFDNTSFEVYDIDDNQWTLLENVALKNYDIPTTAVINEKIFIIGGGEKKTDEQTIVTDTVSCFDTGQRALAGTSKLPFPCIYHVCALVTAPRK